MTERKLGIALTLGIVLEVVEILRRTPRWLLLALAIVAYFIAYLVYTHLWLTALVVLSFLVLRAAVSSRR